MALHEKGRAALKGDDYSSALVMFLDADKEFRLVRNERNVDYHES